MSILLKLLTGGVLREEQFSEILKAVDRAWRKRVKLIGGCFFQAEGKDLTHDGVISGMNHHLVLILIEMLDQVALTGVAIKGQNRELLRKFII